MIESIAQWFISNPTEKVLIVFGSGGFVAACFHWGMIWFGRRRIRVRIMNEHFDVKESPNIEVRLSFEVTNIGERSTSLDSNVVVRSLTPKREKMSFVLPVVEIDRQLTPHEQRSFTAIDKTSAVYPYCWFKRYTFRVSRGGGANIHYRNAKNEEIGFARYWGEYAFFKFTGQIIRSA